MFTGRTVYPANADGDGHSSYDEGSQLLFAADEDFSENPGPESRPASGTCGSTTTRIPRRRADRLVPDTELRGQGSAGSSDYSLHNHFLVGDTVYRSWYSDGVRVVDVSDRRIPRSWRISSRRQTDPVKPPQRGTSADATGLGRCVDDATGLIYASDMNSGLWIWNHR